VPRAARRLASGAIDCLSPSAWDHLGALLPTRFRPSHFGDKVIKGAGLLTAADPLAMYGRLISQWPDPRQVLPRTIEPAGWAERHGHETRGLDVVAQMRLLDMLTYLPDDILTKVDRASMAVGLEVRVPLLDHRVIEKAWHFPSDVLIRNGQGKRPLRAVLDKYVPKSLVDRPKMGFGVPIEEWLKGPLRPWAEDLLSPSALADGLFDAVTVRTRFTEHLSGRRNWQHALWTLLQFQAWRRVYG
jgi:asparagine synthase (glutamine-hydrolysing)